MIPKSIYYKLVRKSDYMILAEGNKKEMWRLVKKTPGTFVGIASPLPQVGTYFGKPPINTHESN